MPTNNSCVDKGHLYGEFDDSERWQDRTYRKAVNKALDIRDRDPLNINQQGLGWKEILAAGTLALGGWSAWLFWNQPSAVTPEIAQPAAVDRDMTRRVDIEKYIPPTDELSK